MRSHLSRTIILSVALVLVFSALPVSQAASAPARGGYCSCSCSFTPNCTTDADCGSGRCLKGPTCC